MLQFLLRGEKRPLARYVLRKVLGMFGLGRLVLVHHNKYLRGEGHWIMRLPHAAAS